MNVLIVGANRGIGYYMVERLLAKGHSVTVLDVETDALCAFERGYPSMFQAIAADARDEQAIARGVREAVVRFGRIDAAVHNACHCTFDVESATDISTYQDVMDVNYFGALRLAKAVLPYMRQAHSGRVLFMSSGVGVTGFAGISPYASSKGAIEALAKCLQLENEDLGISFHVLHPPLTNTASASGLPVPEEFKADAKKVGYGLADHLWGDQFVICHSLGQKIQIRFSYRHPLFIGRLMTKMTERAKKTN